MKTITEQNFINTMTDLMADCYARDLIYKADYTISHRADPKDADARNHYFEYRNTIASRTCGYIDVINEFAGPYDFNTLPEIQHAAHEQARDLAAVLLTGNKVYGVRNDTMAVMAELETTRI